MTEFSKAKKPEVTHKIITAAKEERLDDLKRLLANYPDYVDEQDDYEHYTPLIWAAKEGKPKAVDVLLAAKANINAQAGWNKTSALMKAAERNQAEIIELLCQNNASINLQNQYKMTALMLAAEQGFHECVEILLKYNANPNIKNEDEYTALLLAAEHGRDETVRKLCAWKGIDIEMSNKFGKNAFIMAAEFGKFESLKILQEYGANVNAESKRGMTALFLASLKKHVSIVEYLVAHGANPTNKSKTMQALSMAASGGNRAIVDLVCTRWPEQVRGNVAALCSACGSGQIEIVELLMKTVDEATLSLPGDGSGNTALTLACEKGNFMLVGIILDKKIEFMRASMEPVEGDILDSAMWLMPNLEGNNAIMLLGNYLREHDDKWEEFINMCVDQIVERPYFMDMFATLLPRAKSPNRLLNGLKDNMIQRLKEKCGFDADLQLIGALTNIAAALQLSAESHQIESRDLLELKERFELALVETMNSPSMDIPENVTKILRRVANDPRRTPEIVSKALAFTSGPLHDCLRYGLTKILASGQILTFVNGVFYGSLKCNRESTIRNISDLFQLRSGCSTYRYSPIVMFIFEGVSKLFFVFVVSIVCITMSSSKGNCSVGAASIFGISCENVWFWENALLLMFITSFLYEAGEIVNKCRSVKGLVPSMDPFYRYITIIGHSVTTTSVHFSDRWNMLDILTIFFIWLWVSSKFIYKIDDDEDEGAQAWLSMSAITLSLGLLRFQSISKSTGQLVIMVFEMINDLQGFLLVFLTCVLGFGIAFHSLFPTLDGFESWHATSLTLFDAALGNHDFDAFKKSDDHQSMGIVLMMVYTILVMIVLLNLIIARMSATHEKIDSSALEVWSRLQAMNTEEFVLLYERNAMCMLPPPLNVVSMSAYMLGLVFQGKEPKNANTGNVDMISIAGTVSDKVTSITMSPICAVMEVYHLNSAIWKSVAPRWIPACVSSLSVIFFPVWCVMFWLMILWSIFSEDLTIINRKTARIQFHDMDHIRNAFRLNKQFLAMIFIFASFLVGRYSGSAWSVPIAVLTVIIVQMIDRQLPTAFFVARILDAKLTVVTPATTKSAVKVGGKGQASSSQKMEAAAIAPKSSKLHSWLVSLFQSSIVDYFIDIVLLKTLGVKCDKVITKTVIFMVVNCALFGFLPAFILPPAVKTLYCCVVYVLLARHYYYETKTLHKASRMFDPETCTLSNIRHASMFPASAAFVKKQFRRSLSSHHHAKNGFIAPCGNLELKIIRGNFSGKGEADFGRKINPYVVINYPYFTHGTSKCNSQHTKTIQRGGASCLWDENMKIHLENNAFLIEVQVYDQDDIDNHDVTHDELLYWKKIDIREWIANKRYEGNIDLGDSMGACKGDFIQVVAKVLYPDASEPMPDKHVPELEKLDNAPLFTVPDRMRIFKPVEDEGDSQADPEEISVISYRAADMPMIPFTPGASTRSQKTPGSNNSMDRYNNTPTLKQMSPASNFATPHPVQQVVVNSQIPSGTVEEINKMIAAVLTMKATSSRKSNKLKKKTKKMEPLSTKTDYGDYEDVGEESELAVDANEAPSLDISRVDPDASVNEAVETPIPSETTVFQKSPAVGFLDCIPESNEFDDAKTDSCVAEADDSTEGGLEAVANANDDDQYAYSDTGAVFGTDAGTDYDSDAPSVDRNRQTIVMSLASAVREGDVRENDGHLPDGSNDGFEMANNEGSSLESVNESALASFASDSHDHLTHRAVLGARSPTAKPDGVAVTPRFSRVYHPSLTSFNDDDNDNDEDNDAVIRNNLVLVYALDLTKARNRDHSVVFVLHDCGFADRCIEIMMSCAQAQDIQFQTGQSLLHLCVCHHYFNTEPILGSFDPRLDDFIVMPTFFFGCGGLSLKQGGVNVTCPLYIHSCKGMVLEDVASRLCCVKSTPSVDSLVDLSDLKQPLLPGAQSSDWVESTSFVDVEVSESGENNLLLGHLRTSELCGIALLVNPKKKQSPKSNERPSLNLSESWELIQQSGLQSHVTAFDRILAKRRSTGATFDCYLSYWWGLDERGRDVHQRVSKINDGLQSRGLVTSFNDTFVFGDSTANTMRAILDSKCMVFFVTQAYLDSIHRDNNSHIQSSARIEFFTAEFRGMFAGPVVVVVLEKRCRKAYLWGGDVGFSFSELLYVDLVEEEPACLYNAQIDELHGAILRAAQSLSAVVSD